MSKILKKCKLCGLEFIPRRWAKGLCHKHIMAFYRRDKRRATALKALEEIRKLEQIVFGKKGLSIETNGTNYITIPHVTVVRI